MGKITFDEKSKFKKFLSGKGFYVALSVCLVAVCGVAVGTFVSSLPPIEQDSSSQTESASPTSGTARTTREQPVDVPVTNVPDDRTTATKAAAAGTTIPTEAPVGPAEPELFILPLSNEVLKEYSDGKQVYDKTMDDWRTHDGVDFKGEKGQKVKALADGTILSVETDPLWGKVITIDHGFGIKSRYCGVEPGDLQKGDEVEVSDVIGTLTDIPCELLEGPHLHLEITVNGKFTDPVEAIGREVKAASAQTATTGKGETGAKTTAASAAGTSSRAGSTTAGK